MSEVKDRGTTGEFYTRITQKVPVHLEGWAGAFASAQFISEVDGSVQKQQKEQIYPLNFSVRSRWERTETSKVPNLSAEFQGAKQMGAYRNNKKSKSIR